MCGPVVTLTARESLGGHHGDKSAYKGLGEVARPSIEKAQSLGDTCVEGRSQACDIMPTEW